MTQALIIFGMFAFFGLMFWWGSKKEKERRDAVEKFCAQQGYQFQAQSQEFQSQSWKSLPLFQRGHSKQMKNVGSRGERGESSMFFDYRFTTGHGKHRQHHLYFVVGRFKDSKLPAFTLSPENVFSKIAQAVGYSDIDFSHDPEFSKAYVLRGNNEASIRAIFSPTILATLKHEKGIHIESDTNGILVYTLPGSIEELQTNITRIQNILRLFPA